MEHETLMETVHHSGRVASLCLMLGEKAGGVDLLLLHICALLHDVGKQSVPESILLKPGKLTAAEFELVKGHAKLGADLVLAISAQLASAHTQRLVHSDARPFPTRTALLGSCGDPMAAIIATLEAAADTAMQHHERYGDGKGYYGMIGEEILPFARIVSLCDVLDALMSRRPYKEPWQLRDALDYVRENAGTQFDPYWADILLGCEGELAEIYKEERTKTQ